MHETRFTETMARLRVLLDTKHKSGVLRFQSLAEFLHMAISSVKYHPVHAPKIHVLLARIEEEVFTYLTPDSQEKLVCCEIGKQDVSAQ